ncbi:probable protein phosphatase 2C 67 [Oryza brachyantha]|uniref:protein-serine/threonine phosphatase n=1 Tax=Oryza brachyantha TaxID=4533 RepID=J3MWG8_ORYBR|nr:probable protein phosphatase 2C 67 [Oryza brachyantha]XP_015696500.1 probable protein phosphatase 2C 67 [Oryza brachyantha]
MVHQKREAASDGNEEWVSKRPKGADAAAEKEHILKSDASQEANVEKAQKGDASRKENTVSTNPCVSEEKAITNSNVSSEREVTLTSVEADAAEDKGCRHTMEDAWVLLPDASMESPGKLRCAHFAIYDGHGGRLAAEYAQKHLHQNVIAAGLPRELMDVKAAKKAIIEGFRKTDEILLQESANGNWQDGATAVCVWVLGQTVFVANAGDAKAVLARSTSTDGNAVVDDTKNQLRSIVLTREHKAIFPQERARIQKTGGSVGPNGRLQGRIEVSRALGDRQFKKVGLIATPDVHSFELTKKDQFIILGCDGLWGVFGPGDAVEFVQNQLKETSSATLAVRRLVKEAVRERRCKDNCTAVLIVFKH